MKIKQIYSSLTILVTTTVVYAQVGINTPNPQATLDVVASTNTAVQDGIMPPRISKQTLASKAAGVYSTAQTGAIVYVDNVVAPSGITPSLVQVANINNTGYYYFNGTQWLSYANLYNSDGSLSGNRTVTQGTNTLSFLSTSVNGFSVDGTTFSIDASNDRVGIGTTTPETKFHVVSTAPTSGRYNVIDAPQSTTEAPILTFRNNSALATDNKAYIGFSNAGPTAGGSNWQIGSIRTSASGGGGQEDFYVGNSTGGGLIERLRILPNTGFVGIGVSVPTNKLHINATNPLRLEGLQGAAATAGSLTVDNTGVVQTRNSSNISAVRATGNITISINNTFTTIGTPSETFDNLNELNATTFTAASTGLYKVDFIINYPQRASTEDTGDGYLGYARIAVNGTDYAIMNVKVTLPETSGAPSYNTCTNSSLVKLSAGNTLTFQGLTFGSTPATTNIVAPYTINIVRID
ncbi:hypothetical protein [Chryseobacterium sp. MMS23-Vi53]|uniref:hypothetical protein n=1 Tax=Chryseobacterium sp. MMS23-Vi53 TaxID=3386644 RepID=UPI0039EB7422